MSNQNEKILNQIDELSALRPEEEYQKEIENEDPVILEQARKKLMLMVNIKCKGAGQDVISGQIKPMVYSMNTSDCEKMCEIIKKKGMFGLPMMIKKQTKRIVQTQ